VTAEGQGTSEPNFPRRRWVLLRWLGLRWERRLAWLVLVLFGGGPVVLAATLFWYVRSGRLASAVERELAGVLGAPVKIDGLQVKGWHRYAIARLTLFGGPDGSRPLLRAEEGELATGKALTATFVRATADVGDEAALAAWRQFLERGGAAGPPDSSLELLMYGVQLEGGPSGGTGLRTAGLAPLQASVTITPDHRRVYLHGRLATQRAKLVVESGEEGTTLSLSPPFVLGRQRLAQSLGWPPALIPGDLEGHVVFSEGPGGRGFRLEADGILDLAQVGRAFKLPGCSGELFLLIDLDLRTGLDARASKGEVLVKLFQTPVLGDALALEVFRYIFFGQLSDRPVEKDFYEVNRIAFTVTLAGDQVTVTGKNGPLLSGRSLAGYSIELSGPAQATTEELARRVRLALGGLPGAQRAPAGEGSEAPSVPASP